MSSPKQYQNFSNKNYSQSFIRSLSISTNSDFGKIIIIMVGLPARGKSYLAGKLCNFFCWRGHDCRVFNAGHFRRKEMSDEPNQTSDFFSSQDLNALAKRNDLAMTLLDEVIEWLTNGSGQIAIFDATNTTKSRRQILANRIKNSNHRFIFIESFCDDPKVIEANLLTKAKMSPDFEGMQLDEALSELRKRLFNYEKVYECLTDEEGYGYIKLVNLGQKLVCHKLHGFISRLLMVFLLNLNIDKNAILITRAGNCTADLLSHTEPNSPTFKSKESGLSEEGLVFAKRLAQLVKSRNLNRMQVWTSTLRRAIETTQFLEIDDVKTEADYQSNPEGRKGKFSIFSTPRLKMVNQGICYGMRPSVIKQTRPDIYSAWREKPLEFRFPGGESYMDAVQRAESLVIDLEQNNSPVLIVTHVSMLRILFAYFKSIPMEKVVNLSFPQGIVLEFQPRIYGWVEQRHDLMADIRKASIDDQLYTDFTDIPVEAEPFV